MPGIEVATPSGPARIHPAPVDDARAVLLLGHSAGGGVDDRALQAARTGAAAAGVSTVLLEMPYRVAGSKRPHGPAEADAAWLAVVAHLREHVPDLVLVSGGRSYGGRIACRTSAAAGAAGVLCLAFPLDPSYGSSRQHELDAVSAPMLVVQGERDPFGRPAPAPPLREVVLVRGDHSLRTALPDVTAHVREWLAGVLGG
ncbi:alpha/beta family hydrolase [Nocardioides bigeumensis]|uniref:Alpha/beta hydrolase n=1 Tax=Nocardioides bigeumensis TaxID=433657 RepID=A0ABP5K3M9_9ACTN